jgi:hypothetical protein
MAADRPANPEPAKLSIPATRINGKPDAGLRKIPQSAQEWLESAVVHGLGVRTLAELCRRGTAFFCSSPSSFSLLGFFVISQTPHWL